MKKILVLGGIAMIALASCKKTKTCECTVTSYGETFKTAYPLKGTKSERKDACSALETNLSGGGYAGSTATCTVD